MQRDLHPVEDVSCAFKHVSPCNGECCHHPTRPYEYRYVPVTAPRCRCAGVTALGRIPATLPPLLTCSCPLLSWATGCPWAGRRPPYLPLGSFSSCAGVSGSSCAVSSLSSLQYCYEQDRSSRRSLS